jgi:hypothetical protein
MMPPEFKGIAERVQSTVYEFSVENGLFTLSLVI